MCKGMKPQWRKGFYREWMAAAGVWNCCDSKTNLLLRRLGEFRKCKRLPEAKLTLLTAEEKGVKGEM